MPLYEYQCQKCHHECELLVRGAEQPQCPQCHSVKLNKKLSVVSAPSRGAGVGAMPEPTMPGMCGRPQCGMNGCQGLG